MDRCWSEYPVVLRNRSAGKKNCLGEPCVHGLMHGEILDLEPDLINIVF